MCGDKKFHLAWKDGTFVCYKCGKLPFMEVYRCLFKTPISDAPRTEYKQEKHVRNKKDTRELKFPSGSLVLSYEKHKKHVRYLNERGLMPELVSMVWDIEIRATLISSDSWGYRVIFPITEMGRVVSYQGRDVTGKSSIRWLTCGNDTGIENPKEILMGVEHTSGRRCVLVEGLFDMFKLGHGAVCCFGTSVTDSQIRTLVQNFDFVHIFFDNEIQAMEKAKKLRNTLISYGIEAKCSTLDADGKDAGDLTVEEGLQVKHNLLKG
jgi:hypothetical protein